MREPKLDPMDRQALLDALSIAMQGHEPDGRLPGHLRAGQVKSRLIEAHPPEPSPDGAGYMLAGLAEDAGVKVKQLGDDLWALVAPEDLYFVDALNSRFWLLHSTARQADVQRLLSRHLLPNPRVDSAWLGSEQLRTVEGDHRWVKTSFSSTLLQPEGEGTDVPRRLKAQVEIESADEFLEFLSENASYTAGAVLTAVGTVLRGDDLGIARVVADYQGTFLSHGSSFHLVAGMLWRALDRYEEYVKGLEDTFRLGTRATEDLGMEIEGDVALIELPRQVEDLDALVENLFTCKEPFRLWSVPRKVSEFQWEANAVDLHVGHPLRLEISPEWIRVMLGPSTCGNTLARLVANLQHRFDARIRAPLPAVVA
jgi:hypothetical protein